MVSSVIAEALSMLIYYPYEIVKVRYIAKNDIYHYRGITHGFASIFKKDGLKGLYKGYYMFLVNYVGSNSIQFVFYETYMDMKKRKWGMEEYRKNENRYVHSIRRANIAGFVKIAVTMLAEGVV